MDTLGIFGGSFDPPHVGHQMLCLYALETGGLDGIVAVPAARHAFGKGLASYEHRVAMCRLAMTALGERVQVSEVEAGLGDGQVVYALDMVKALATARPGVHWRLLVGGDISGETHRWHRWDDVARLAPPLVVPRGSGEPLAIPDVSSSRVRELLARDPRSDELCGLVPASVLAYARAEGLYG